MKINDRTIKNIFPTLLTFIFSLSILVAQNDTMYVMKDGVIVDKYNINTEIDSLIFYHPYIQTDSSFTDFRDGNVYKTVTIGSQLWMAENLKYLPEVIGPATGSDTISYYYVYGYDGTNVTDAKATSNYDTYGVLYNWTAAMDGDTSSTANPSGVQGVCPNGWHLPSNAEWTELTNYLGGESIAGGKLKETDTIHWSSPNTGANNETGFTALPGGARLNGGTFGNLGDYGNWWTCTGVGTNSAWYRYMNFDDSKVDKTYVVLTSLGFTVRCIKD
jgi:uncharacterized protein (TIGR02145 family)